MGRKWEYEVKFENGETVNLEVEETTKGFIFTEKVYEVRKKGFWSGEKLGEVKKLSDLRAFLEAKYMSEVKKLEMKA